MDDREYDRLADMIADRLGRQHNRDHPPADVMTTARVEEVVRRVVSEQIDKAIQKTVADTLISFGLDPLQRSEIQRDFLFIRDMRVLSADSKKHIVLALLGALTLGVCTAVWFYVKSTGKA